MARLKTAYRPKSEATELNSAEAINSNAEIPADQLPVEDFLHRELGSPPTPAAQSDQPQESDASHALLAQIEAGRRAEEIQHQRQAQAAAERRRVDWLSSTPLAQQNYAALGALHQEAMQAGLDDLSPEYFAHMESGLEALEPQQPVETQSMPVERPAAAPAETPTPEFFQPRPVKMSAPRSSALVSAPVSRSIPSADRDRLSSNPASVKLTPAMREAAKIAGVDELTYAKGLIAIEREKAEGRRQG